MTSNHKKYLEAVFKLTFKGVYKIYRGLRFIFLRIIHPVEHKKFHSEFKLWCVLLLVFFSTLYAVLVNFNIIADFLGVFAHIVQTDPS